MYALEELLKKASILRFINDSIHVYLIDVEGDPTKGLYGEDGEGKNAGGFGRTTTKEKAIATTQATAEVVTYAQAWSHDHDFSNQSYEFKTIYRTLEGRTYITGPSCYKRRLYLDEFVGG